MKKITSFLTLMVLCFVSAFAQEVVVTPVTSLDQLDDSKFYTLQSERTFLLYSPAVPNKLVSGNGTSVSAEYNPMDPTQHFQIKKINEKYYLYSVGASKYVSVDNNANSGVFVDEPDAEFTIQTSNSSEYPWFLGLGAKYMNSQNTGQTAEGIIVNGWNEQDAGNRYKITAVEVSGVDEYEFAFNRLTAAITSVQEALNVTDLKAGKNVGASYGNYKPEIVEYFLAKHDSAVNMVDAVQGEGLDPLKVMFPEVAKMDAFTVRYVESKDSVVENTVPREIPDIAPGYYTISSGITFTKTDTVYVYYTEEEAEEENLLSGAGPGDEDYIEAGVTVKDRIPKTVAQDPKALYEYNGKAYWGDRRETADFLWKIEKGDTAKAYKIVNVNQGMTFARINTSREVTMEKNDTSEYFITWWGLDTLADNSVVDLIAIRNIVDGPNSAKYVHCNNHSDGTGKNGNIVGWYPSTPASQWFLTSVSKENAAQWIENMKPILKLRSQIKEGDSIAAAFPAQLEIAKDIETIIFKDSVVTDPSQFSSPYTETREGDITKLLDGDPSTYWHSDWSSNVAAHVHYLQIEAAAPIEGMKAVKMSRRANAQNDHPVKLVVKGYDTNNEALTYEDGDSLATLNFPFQTHGETVVSNDLFDAKGYKVFRFYWEDSNGGTDRGYWHCSEFNIFNAHRGPRYETTQYDVRQAEADALDAAIKTWNEGEFRDDSLELVGDAPFAAAYDNIVAKGKAWGAVYVNPAELRETIETKTYDEKLFPIGNNPGEWSSKEGITVITTVANAEAYNASGAYTKEQTAEWIKAINDADSLTFASANGVKTDVWYQFAFPAEEMFDEFGWDKVAGQKTVKAAADTHTGDEIVRCEGIFGKVVAAGLGANEYFYTKGGVTDTVTIYKVADAEGDFYAGQNMFFYTEDEIENFELGEQLFRFIEATDSSYIIQNKATGLFLRGGHPCTLSPIPTYWSTKALGAGGNLVRYTDILGNEVSNLKYLHGQNSDRRLVCWETDEIGSRSMMLIQEVEPVTEEPATEYQMEIWPGTINAMTMPVDITIVEVDGWDTPTAYGASLKVTETDTTLVLKTITDKTIKAGCPFLLLCEPTLIAEDSVEYESKADATERIKQEIDKNYVPGSEKETETWKYWNNNELNGKLSMGYCVAMLDHGMDVKSEARWVGSLRGTMKADTIAAGKGYVAVDNKFAIVNETTDIAAYSAYIDANFSAETEGSLIIDLNGDPIVDTGITEVLNKVAKSGNIYNAAGQLVGKGNLNTVNSLPAGVYIVNGVKVTKR